MTIMTGTDHPCQFALKLLKTIDLATNHLQLSRGNLVGILTGVFRMGAKIEQFADRLYCKAKIARMLDEGEAITVRWFEPALVTLRAVCWFHQPHFFIVPNGRDFYAGLFREFPDG